MRLAVLADIHGNLPALEAVIAALERLQPDQVVLNGDMIIGSPFSSEVIDRVRSQGWIVVRGNHEFYYLDFGTPRALPGTDDPARWGGLHWLVERLTPAQGAYLGMLPDEHTFYLPGAEPLRIAHGVPGRNRVGFYPDQPAASVARELMGIQEATVISAHTHVQVDRHIRIRADALPNAPVEGNGHDVGRQHNHHDHNDQTNHRDNRHWHLINPGSVGLPLNGDPAAQFAILESVPASEEPGGWRATHIRVRYDRRPALEAFGTSGLMAAGGVMAELFYWELATAEQEILRFFRWAREHGFDLDGNMAAAFDAYTAATQRDVYVRRHDPLYVRDAI
ncbi:MAG TPA: metallophosphoesterase [Caldilineaceae bacterium]|nr:metallophosphoesterase [Caldilineaceae bacterium]